MIHRRAFAGASSRAGKAECNGTAERVDTAPRRRIADAPLLALALVGAVFVGGLAVLIASGSLPPDPLESCETMAATLAARVMTVGMLTPTGILLVALLAGILALLHQIWATRRMLHGVMAERGRMSPRLARLAREVGIDGRVDVIADDAVYTFCHGLRHPRVCVSTGLVDLLSDQELQAVMRHEAHHARHGDPLKILIGRTIASALFFLPLAGALRNAFLAGKEICADADATAASGDVHLASALLKMLQGDRPTWPAGVLAIGALSPTEARIKHLLEPESSASALPSAFDWILSAALVAGIFGFSYGSAAARTDEGFDTHCSNPAAVQWWQRSAPATLPIALPVTEDAQHAHRESGSSFRSVALAQEPAAASH